MERIRERPALPGADVPRPTSSFADLADLWLADLKLRDLASTTKESYRTCLRLHARSAFEHHTLADVTIGQGLAGQSPSATCRRRGRRTLHGLA